MFRFWNTEADCAGRKIQSPVVKLVEDEAGVYVGRGAGTV